MTDIFTTLLFGSGAWIGFLIIIIISFVAITIYRGLGVVTFVLSVLFGLQIYNLYSAGNNDLMWLFVLYWISAIFQLLYMIKREN